MLLTVSGTPLGSMLVPSKKMPDDSGLTMWAAVVKESMGVGGLSLGWAEASLSVLSSLPLWGMRVYTLLDTVIAGPPAEYLIPPMFAPDGSRESI